MNNLTEEIASIPVVEQVTNFVRMLAMPTDILELRLIRPAEPISEITKMWCTPMELAGMLPQLQKQNEAGFNIYLGANARRANGLSGDAHVISARTVFCDCDPANGFRGVETFLERIAAWRLPGPSAVVDSGHGCWAFWRLSVPVTDMSQWREMQRGLSVILKTDSTVCNPERIVRLPGFVNHKPPKARAFLWSINGTLAYPVDTLTGLITQQSTTSPRRPAIASSADSSSALRRRARAYVAVAEGMGEGARNAAVYRLAGHVASFVGEGGEVLGENEIADVLFDFNRRCTPPLNEAEFLKAVHSALQSGKPRELKLPQSKSPRIRHAMRCALTGVKQ